MIGVFLRHPSRFKSVPRPQSNIMTRALSASVTDTKFKRTPFSATLASIPPLKGCGSVISYPDPVMVPERFEQIQLAQSSEDVLPLVPRRSEPEVLTSLTASQGGLPIQPQDTQFPVLHAAPHQEQHIPLYEPQLTVPLSGAPEVSMDRPQTLLDSMTFQQLSEDMDIDLDCPQPIMRGLQLYFSSTTGSASPACPQFHPLQNQFTNASQSQFTDVVSGFLSSGDSSSYGPPMLQCTWAPHSRGEPSLPSPQEPFPVGSCAPEWTSPYPPSGTMTTALQSNVIQLLQDANATDFNVRPDTATSYFGISQQPATANPTRSSHAECISTGDMSLDENHDLPRPVSVDHVQAQTIDQNVHQTQTLPVSSSDHQPKVGSRPSSPVGTVKAKGELATFVSDREVTNVINDS